MAIELVEADASDAEPIAEVFIAARTGMTYLSEPPYPKEQTVDFFRGIIENPESTVLDAVTEGGSVAGFGVFGERRIDHLYVLPAYQGQGVGTRLLTQAQARFGHLEGWVFEKNTEAVKLYERHGFEVVERTDGSRNEEHEPDLRIVWTRS